MLNKYTILIARHKLQDVFNDLAQHGSVTLKGTRIPETVCSSVDEVFETVYRPESEVPKSRKDREYDRDYKPLIEKEDEAEKLKTYALGAYMVGTISAREYKAILTYYKDHADPQQRPSFNGSETLEDRIKDGGDCFYGVVTIDEFVDRWEGKYGLNVFDIKGNIVDHDECVSESSVATADKPPEADTPGLYGLRSANDVITRIMHRAQRSDTEQSAINYDIDLIGYPVLRGIVEYSERALMDGDMSPEMYYSLVGGYVKKSYHQQARKALDRDSQAADQLATLEGMFPSLFADETLDPQRDEQVATLEAMFAVKFPSERFEL